MISLYIDTSNNREINLQLEINGDKKSDSKPIFQRTEKALVFIEELLRENSLTLDKIDKIYVKRGPGSFTGLRVGVSIANSLSFALGIPINDNDQGYIEDATY